VALTELSSQTDLRSEVVLSPQEGAADPAIVWLRGEHDLATVSALSGALARSIAANEADLVVDLSDVQFMDASTVGVIVRARRFLEERSRSLALRAPSASAQLVLSICDLTDLVAAEPLSDPGLAAVEDAPRP